MSGVINKKAQEKVRAIHQLSRLVNGRKKQRHEEELLKLMEKHIQEIRELRLKKDKHYLTETGDLVVLCFELLMENRVSLNETLAVCFQRYEKKLRSLVRRAKS